MTDQKQAQKPVDLLAAATCEARDNLPRQLRDFVFNKCMVDAKLGYDGWEGGLDGTYPSGVLEATERLLTADGLDTRLIRDWQNKYTFRVSWDKRPSGIQVIGSLTRDVFNLHKIQKSESASIEKE